MESLHKLANKIHTKLLQPEYRDQHRAFLFSITRFLCLNDKGFMDRARKPLFNTRKKIEVENPIVLKPLAENLSKEPCMICYDDYKPGELSAQMTCCKDKHMHLACFLKCKYRQNCCPFCREADISLPLSF